MVAVHQCWKEGGFCKEGAYFAQLVAADQEWLAHRVGAWHTPAGLAFMFPIAKYMGSSLNIRENWF